MAPCDASYVTLRYHRPCFKEQLCSKTTLHNIQINGGGNVLWECDIMLATRVNFDSDPGNSANTVSLDPKHR